MTENNFIENEESMFKEEKTFQENEDEREYLEGDEKFKQKENVESELFGESELCFLPNNNAFSELFSNIQLLELPRYNHLSNVQLLELPDEIEPNQLSNVQPLELPDELEPNQLGKDSNAKLAFQDKFVNCNCFDFVGDKLGKGKSSETEICSSPDDIELSKLSNLKYFEDALIQSRNLMEESGLWISNVKNRPLKGTQFLLNQTKPILADTSLENRLDEEQQIKLLCLEDGLVLTDLEITEEFCFNTLPNELKLKIFSFFSQRELCCYVAPVCSSWFHLSKDSSLWQTLLCSHFEDVNNKLLVKLLVSWCKHITKLELNRRSLLTLTEFREIFQNCLNLQHISFAFCTQINDEILSLLNTCCKNISSVNMEGCHEVSDKSFYSFIGLKLKRINVSHCHQLSDDGGIFLARNFQNLIEINFDGIQWITEDFVQLLVENHYETLGKIFLDGENLTDNAVRLLSRCKNLRTLSFSFCTSMTHHALQWASQCHNISRLQLRKGTYFTNSALLSYFKDMGEIQSKSFKYLNLAECTEISDECLFHLSERCSNLEVLDLSWCWEVSDDGLAFIVDTCHHLKELYLRGLHELYGTPFTCIVTSLPKLTFLDLSQCNKIQDELIECVVSNKNDLVILNYYGDTVVNVNHRRSHLLT